MTTDCSKSMLINHRGRADTAASRLHEFPIISTDQHHHLAAACLSTRAYRQTQNSIQFPCIEPGPRLTASQDSLYYNLTKIKLAFDVQYKIVKLTYLVALAL